MGDVYLAHDVDLLGDQVAPEEVGTRVSGAETIRRRVAIKVIRTGMDGAEMNRRIRAEYSKNAALGTHPNIAALFHAGSTEDGLPYLVMEYIRGGRPIDRLYDDEGYDLRLMSPVEAERDIPTEGKSLIIVADVRGTLHFRIFEADGRRAVDTDESELADKAAPIAELKQILSGLWQAPQLSQSDKDRVRDAVTSIVGHTHDEALTIRDRVRLFRSVLEGVQHAHKHLVVHLDLKPGNILVADDGTPKLVDFGVARLLGRHAPGVAGRPKRPTA